MFGPQIYTTQKPRTMEKVNIDAKFYQSITPQRLKLNPLYRKLIKHYTEHEAIQILRKYNIGTSTTGQTAFWYFTDKLKTDAVRVNDKCHYGIEGIWNMPVLMSNEPFTRLGICSTPEDAFWANLYLRDYAVWTTFGMATRLDPIIGVEAFAVLNTDDKAVREKLALFMPYVEIRDFDNFGEHLQTQGKPEPFVIHPRHKLIREQTVIEKLDEILLHPNVQFLIERMGLELF